jgi:hypothetical protein
MMNQTLFSQRLRQMNLDELLSALVASARKLGGRPFAHEAADAHQEIKLIKTEITQRFNRNDF